MNCLLGIDVGTSGVKALLLSEAGDVVGSESVPYPLLTPRPGWAEQHPEEWWRATVAAVRSCLERVRSTGVEPPEVLAVGLSGQMHSSVFLDDTGHVLRPAILWCDQRTESECSEIRDAIGRERLLGLTSNEALAGFTAPKILWVRHNEPEVYARLRKVLLPKDYIRHRLTGGYATDVSDASGTLLFNVADRKWSDEVLEALKIPREWLPHCYESTDITGGISRGAGASLGLREGTPVVAGGGDQAAGAVGNGVVREGLVSCVLGTSGVVFWHLEKPASGVDGRLHLFCHAVPGKWHLMGVTLAAGGSLRWFRDTLCEVQGGQAQPPVHDSYERIIEIAGGVTPGSEGLIFLPYLAGERTPHADANALGAFIGLTIRHTKAHMSRAVLEGITMSLKDCFELGRGFGLIPERISLSGGGARSEFWRQLVADVIGVEVRRARIDEGAAFGASILAGVAADVYGSVEEACDSLVREADSKRPNPENVETYRRLYEVYNPLYAALKPHFERSAGLAQRSL